MAAVGRGEMKASNVARAMYPDYKEERGARYGAKKSLPLKSPSDPARSPSAIPIRGINSDLPVKFAPNGGAVPGLEGFRGGARALARRALGCR